MKKVRRINNEGFSLVELIIVIAIMAILAAALAPQLIKYIDNSRKSTDVQSGQSIATAVGVALTNEEAYSDALSSMTGTPPSATFWVSACKSTAPATDVFEKTVGEIIGTTPPKPKYRGAGTGDRYNDFAIVITKNDTTVSFAIYPAAKAAGNNDYTIVPNDMVYPTVGSNYAD
jgi:type IV pilus assembly protein PilA